MPRRESRMKAILIVASVLWIGSFPLFWDGACHAATDPPAPQEQLRDVEEKHLQMLSPTVRVKTSSASGSGTVFFSEDREKDGTIETFILTNHHVVDDAISIRKQWNNLLQRYRDVEVLDQVIVEVFRYTPDGRGNGRVQYNADIAAYDPVEDLALLQLAANVRIKHTAKMLPATAPTPRMFDVVHAIGCSLSHPPVPTCGQITSVSVMIDRRVYWMTSAPIVFGNSGGAAFVERGGTYYFIGVPARIASTRGNVVPHMSYIVPVTRVRAWLAEQRLTFFFDEKTPAECFRERDRLRESRK